ncbi:MAG TPA: CPBP family intramembrane glutamic endopeptidase [Nocardioides sp.]|nr:CPBP family intramembrane glutamic endopeptidase [Nocardioides sp.]
MTEPTVTTLRRWSDRLPRGLGHVVDVHETDSPAERRRRRRVSAGTLLAGTGLLGASLSTRPGSRPFYGLTFATALTWITGGLLSGPLQRGWIENRARMLNRPVVVPVATGVATFGVFCAGSLVARRIPVLDRAVSSALDFAEGGSGPVVLLTTCANGLGEEVFFRGALYAALPESHPVATSTAAYVLTTVATRNPALVLAATVMGTLFGYQRRATGGLQAPLLTHLTWSTLMVAVLPRVFRGGRHRSGAAS